MKIDQIAFYAADEHQANQIKAVFGLTEAPWVEDTVVAEGTVYGKPAKNVARLQFCYDLGIELEILTYIAGDNFCDRAAVAKSHDSERPFISHVGIHLNDDEPWPELSLPLAQEVETQSHTNDFLLHTGRRYQYRIYELQPGHYIKYIKRIRGENE